MHGVLDWVEWACTSIRILNCIYYNVGSLRHMHYVRSYMFLDIYVKQINFQYIYLHIYFGQFLCNPKNLSRNSITIAYLRNVKLIQFKLSWYKNIKTERNENFLSWLRAILYATPHKKLETIEIHQKTVHHVLYNISTFFPSVSFGLLVV